MALSANSVLITVSFQTAQTAFCITTGHLDSRLPSVSVDVFTLNLSYPLASSAGCWFFVEALKFFSLIKSTGQ